MVDEGASAQEVFRRSTMNRIASADELDHYIKVTNPSAWVVTIAAFLLVAGIIVWAFVATVPVTIETTGVLIDSSDNSKMAVVCFVDKSTADKIDKSGAIASASDVAAESVAVNPTPVSSTEIVNFFDSDFYVEALHLSDWNYVVSLAIDEEPATTDYSINIKSGEARLVPVKIVVYETHPINIIMEKK